MSGMNAISIIDDLYLEARHYIKEMSQTTISKLCLHLGLYNHQATAGDCMNAILRLRDDRDIIIEGSIYPIQSDTDVILRYEKPEIELENGITSYIEAIKYLRKLFPNMTIDLGSNKLKSDITGKHLVPSQNKCPVCGENMYVDDSVIFPSDPPQYQFYCKICGNRTTDRFENGKLQKF